MYLTREQLGTIVKVVDTYNTDNGTVTPKSGAIENLISEISKFNLYESCSIKVTIDIEGWGNCRGEKTTFCYSDGYLMYDDGNK